MKLVPTVSLLLFLLSQAIQAQSEPIQEDNQELEQMLKGDSEDVKNLSDSLKNGGLAPAQAEAMRERTKKRLQRVLELVRQQKLVTGRDYFRAALILQHGFEAEHYLLAHVLATLAAFKGNEPSKWLVAASLDRFLQRVDQAQIFGTQWHIGPEKPRTFTMEPYSRELLTDAIRGEYRVPPLAEQEKMIEGMLNLKPK
jgi:hypothetical protein